MRFSLIKYQGLAFIVIVFFFSNSQLCFSQTNNGSVSQMLENVYTESGRHGLGQRARGPGLGGFDLPFAAAKWFADIKCNGAQVAEMEQRLFQIRSSICEVTTYRVIVDQANCNVQIIEPNKFGDDGVVKHPASNLKVYDMPVMPLHALNPSSHDNNAPPNPCDDDSKVRTYVLLVKDPTGSVVEHSFWRGSENQLNWMKKEGAINYLLPSINEQNKLSENYVSEGKCALVYKTNKSGKIRFYKDEMHDNATDARTEWKERKATSDKLGLGWEFVKIVCDEKMEWAGGLMDTDFWAD